MPLVVA